MSNGPSTHSAMGNAAAAQHSYCPRAFIARCCSPRVPLLSVWLAAMFPSSAAVSEPSHTSSSCRGRLDFLSVLPVAVCVSIATYLPLPSVASCTAVSALMFVVCQHDRVWRQQCAVRWRQLQHARTLLTEHEWTAMYGEDEEGESDEEEAGSAHSGGGGGSSSSTHRPVATAGVSGSAGGTATASDNAASDSDSPVLSWKERYIGCEMDLCRSYITMDEVTQARWAFKFLPHVFFNHGQVRSHTARHPLCLTLLLPPHCLSCLPPCLVTLSMCCVVLSQLSYPVFTPGRLITGLDMTYEWRFVDSERAMPAVCRERGEMTAYERRRLVSGERIGRLRTANRPYWLRSSGTEAPSIAAAARFVDGSADSSGAPQARLSAASALSSASLPAYRFLPGHPFFRLTPEQLADCASERRLQVSHFPALSISRLPDGGWQMLNQYVLFRSVPSHTPHSQHSAQQPTDEEEEEGQEDGSGDDDSDQEASEGEDEDDPSDGEDVDAPLHENDEQMYNNTIH